MDLLETLLRAGPDVQVEFQSSVPLPKAVRAAAQAIMRHNRFTFREDMEKNVLVHMGTRNDGRTFNLKIHADPVLRWAPAGPRADFLELTASVFNAKQNLETISPAVSVKDTFVSVMSDSAYGLLATMYICMEVSSGRIRLDHAQDALQGALRASEQHGLAAFDAIASAVGVVIYDDKYNETTDTRTGIIGGVVGFLGGAALASLVTQRNTVLVPGGREKPVSEIAVGDLVVAPDGRTYRVRADRTLEPVDSTDFSFGRKKKDAVIEALAKEASAPGLTQRVVGFLLPKKGKKPNSDLSTHLIVKAEAKERGDWAISRAGGTMTVDGSAVEPKGLLRSSDGRPWHIFEFKGAVPK